jgi:P-type Ca2+ transporter type 2C
MEEKEIIGKPFHSYSKEKFFKILLSSPSGISDDEAKKRSSVFGLNEINKKEKSNPFLIFLKQFNSVLIYILVVAGMIAFFYGKMIDFYVIFSVIFLNGIMGFIQEYRADKAISALKKIIVPYAKVYRNGEMVKIDAKYLVPGDVISLEEGDKIPADSRLFEANNFRTVESSLTGESTPTRKKIEEINKDVSMADRKNMAWMGTFVAAGQARAIVTSIGMNTFFGRIAEDISEIKKKKNHFEKKIDKLAKQMGVIALIGSFFIFAIGFFVKGLEFQEVLFFTIASLVSGIPEGLPAVLIIILSLGAGRMAKRNAIIRRLPATETLGVTTVISTDKTGTLTQNTMNVREIIFSDKDNIDVTGGGWEPLGDFYKSKIKISPLEEPVLNKIIHLAAICNNAKVIKDTEENQYKIIGDPTEASLVVLADKAGLKKEMLKELKLDDMSFSSELKYRASLYENKEDGKKEVCIVGAPEVIIARSKYFLSDSGIVKMTESKKEEINKKIELLTQKAMRSIALSYREISPKDGSLSDDIVHDMIFTGVVGIIDPPRPEARESVLRAKKAGIRVIMTTGDHKGTALAISKEVGIIDSINDQAVTESDLLKMNEREFRKTVKNVNVFARLTPRMKLKIASTLQDQGEVVAMTGDGVNDAPALKKADIGIAMGITGTDVARESSEIILIDDNFASIVGAVEEGRIVFNNTRQTSTFLITTNFAEHATLISSLLLFSQLPLLATQILWLNLVIDGVSGFALAAEPGHGDVLNNPPKKKNENIMSKEIIPFLLFMTIIMAILTLSFFRYHLSVDGDINKARTAAFTVMAFTQLFNVLNMRSMRLSLFKIGLFSNKYILISLAVSLALQLMSLYLLFPIFYFVPLSFFELIIIFILSSLVFWFGELYKYIRYSKKVFVS